MLRVKKEKVSSLVRTRSKKRDGDHPDNGGRGEVGYNSNRNLVAIDNNIPQCGPKGDIFLGLDIKRMIGS